MGDGFYVLTLQQEVDGHGAEEIVREQIHLLGPLAVLLISFFRKLWLVPVVCCSQLTDIAVVYIQFPEVITFSGV